MKLSLGLVWLGLLATAGYGCAAETRWCAITGTRAQDHIVYPPIARAASVSGIVIGRLEFMPNGEVLGWTAVLGPPLLSEAMGGQMKLWTISTDVGGGEPCQAMVIGEFLLSDKPEAPSASSPTPAVLHRIVIRAERMVLSDPSPTLVERRRFRFWERR